MHLKILGVTQGGTQGDECRGNRIEVALTDDGCPGRSCRQRIWEGISLDGPRYLQLSGIAGRGVYWSPEGTQQTPQMLGLPGYPTFRGLKHSNFT